MSPLVSPIGRVLNKGSNEHRKRHRALQETTSRSGGIQNRWSPREGIETDTSVVSAARTHGSGMSCPGVMRTPNQDAQGSASPDGVERAVPDQDQAVMAAARRTNWRTTMVSPRPCESSGRGRHFRPRVLASPPLLIHRAMREERAAAPALVQHVHDRLEACLHLLDMHQPPGQLAELFFAQSRHIV